MALNCSEIGPEVGFGVMSGYAQNERIESASLPTADVEADVRRPPLGANNGHRKLLHLRFRGSEFDDGDQSNQNEDGQHSGLRDREGWFGLRRSQRIESRNLHEALHD